MKTRMWQTLSATGIALALTVNAADEPKPAPPADPTAAPANAAPVNVAAPPATPAAPAAPAPAPAPADTGAVKVLQFPKPGLPPLLDQVVKLSQSGTDESVIRAYVDKAAPPYRITGNEIVQLRDLGISQGVIMALIEHSQSAGAASVTEMVGAQTPPAQALPGTNVVTAPMTPPEAAEFYDALSPYGTWLDVAGYGYCWQPSVVVIDSGWRPYCDGGYWLWSDYGWYWHSYYSWGWAPFHYGRWFCHGSRGWLWCPDRVWGSSWVCWRNSATHCGWAPLPPGACFTGHGWTHHGVHVGADFGFGIAAGHFTFVAHDKFSDRNVGTHSLRGNAATTAYNNARVLNSYALGANNTVVNNGIGRETIAAAARTPVRGIL